MKRRRLTAVQRELLALVRSGVRPTLRPGPAAVVKLPPDEDVRWRRAHAGKPVLSSTIKALETRGLITHEVRMERGRRLLVYVPASDSQCVSEGRIQQIDQNQQKLKCTEGNSPSG